MSRLAISIALLAVIQFALQSNAIEYLSGDGYSTAVIMLISSVVMLFISTAICIGKGLSPLPVNWRMQRSRLVCSGLGLYLATLSYYYLPATTATLLFQLSIPFIIILSAFSSRQIDRRFLLSIIVIGLTFLFFGVTSYTHESGIGLLIALLAVAIQAMSYLLAKQSIGVENQYVIINVTCLSCIAVSLLTLSFTNQNGWHYDPVDVMMLMGIGLLRYGQYVCLILLLGLYSTDRAQYPFLLGVVATMVMEIWLKHHFFPIPYMGAVLMLTVLIGGIIFMPIHKPIATIESASD